MKEGKTESESNAEPERIHNVRENHAHSQNSQPVTAALPDIMEYVAIIRQHIILAFVVASLVTGVFWFSKHQTIPVYGSVAKLIIDKSVDQVLDIEQVVDTSLRDESELGVHISQLLSDRMIKWLSESFSESETEEILKPYLAEGGDKKLKKVLRSGLNARRGSEKRVIYIEFKHRDPEVAAMVSNRVADEYVNFIVNRTAESNRAASSFLSNQAEQLTKRVEEGELKLHNYRQSRNLVSLEQSQNLVLDRLKHLDSALSVNKVRLLSLQAQVTQINKAEGSEEALLALPEIAKYQNIPGIQSELENLLEERITLSMSYLAKHPKMVEIDQRIAHLRQRLSDNLRRAVQEYRNALSTVEEENRLLVENLSQAEKESLELDKLAVDYNQIRRELDNDKRMLDQILDRLTETRISTQLSNTNFRILDYAKPPIAPSNIQSGKWMLYSLVIFVGLLVGIPVTINLLDFKIKNSLEIEEIVKQPVLGEIKFLGKEDREHAKQLVAGNLNHQVSENFRFIFGNIAMLSRKQPPKTIIVTSALPEEGKSFVASNLASTYANHGHKTILIDCDLRRPSIQSGFDFKHDKGIITVLEEDEELATAIEEVPLEHGKKSEGVLHILKSGGTTQRATEVFQSLKFSKLLKELRSKFDVVIIDTPPAGLFPDSLMLSEHANEILLVLRHHKVNRRTAKHLVKRLGGAAAPVVGVVVNAIKASALNSGAYSSYGYGGYGYKKAYSSKSKSSDT